VLFFGKDPGKIGAKGKLLEINHPDQDYPYCIRNPSKKWGNQGKEKKIKRGEELEGVGPKTSKTIRWGAD